LYRKRESGKVHQRFIKGRLFLKMTYIYDTKTTVVSHRYMDHTLVKSLHGLLNCKIGGLDCRGITTEYITCGH